jgi:hypothetical protein
MVTLNIFSLVETEVVSGQVQQPITNFTWPWDDFMVDGGNNPLISWDCMKHAISTRWLAISNANRCRSHFPQSLWSLYEILFHSHAHD